MLTLYNENLEPITDIYQWSKNICVVIKLADCSNVCAVEFFNESYEKAKPVKFKTTENAIVAQIPNVFLTEDKTITVFVSEHIGTDGITTTHTALLQVNCRPKPDDYIHDEPELGSYEALCKRVAEMERKIESGAIGGGAKEIYIGPGEPPEDAVLQIDLTAEPDIIPFLPGTKKCVKGQTIVVSEVDENGIPTAWIPADLPTGGGGSNEWEKVVDVTTTEEVSRIGVNTDINGNPLNLDINDEICIFFIAAPTATNNEKQATSFSFNSTNALLGAFGYVGNVIYTSQYYTLRYVKTTPSFPSGWITYSTAFYYSTTNKLETGWSNSNSGEMIKYFGKNINSIWYSNHDNGMLGIGSRIVAYVRKG